ncbi:M116 protein [Murid betaherpesvirus 1]|uniref:M116 protein n=1 Tax=Murid herpesvirus 1 TaxID=10366 RepID=H2A3B6_MUHV1|nr:M116 protein [Murid betaherpesvirus 1]
MFRVGALLCVAYAVTAVYIIPDVKHLQTHSPGGGRAQNSVTSKQPSIPKQPKLDRGLREVQSDPGTSQPAANANSSDAAPEKSTMSSPNPAQTAQAGENGNETTVVAPAPPAAPAPAAASASAASTRAETPAVAAAAAATTAAKKRVSTILSRASDGTKILTPTDGTKILIYASSSSDSSDISSDDSDSETNSSSSEPSNSSLPPGSETEPSSSSSYSSSSSSSSSPSSSDSEDEPSSSSSSTSSDGASSDSEAPSSDSGSESIGSTSPKSESESSDSEKDQEKNKRPSTPASTRASSPQPGAAPAAPANTEPARDASTELSSKMLSASIVDKPTKLADAAKTTPQQVTNATGGDDALVVLTVGSITNSPLSDNRSTQSATTVQTESGHAGLQKETPKKATSLSTLKRAGRQTRELQQSSETATITDASRVPSTVTAVPPTSIPYLTTLTTAPSTSTSDVDNNTNTIITAITTKDPATTAVPSRASLTVTPLLSSSSSSTISFSSFPSEPQTQLSVTQNATNKDNEWINSTESVSSPSAAFRTQVVTTTTTTTNPTITTFPGDLCTRRYCPAKYGPFVLSAFTRVTFSRAECASDVAIFNDSLIIDPGLGASVFLTIYKRLSLTNRMIRLASELTEYTYTPADFI